MRFLKINWNHTRGSADYSAYFFLRGFEHLQFGGTEGLIATNTIGQGDTRELGLAHIDKRGGEIFNATNNHPWPGAAAVSVNIVHVYKGKYGGLKFLDGINVKRITSFLDDMPMLGPPHQLTTNANQSFQGSNILGIGFTMSPDEAQALIEKNPRNSEVLFPFLNGQDLNSNPDQLPSRWVINFFDWPLETAEHYSDCMKIVREKVYPERRKNNNKQRREIWWRFTRPTIDLYTTIASLRRVMVVALTSKYLSFTFVSSKWVYSHACGVIAFDKADKFSILQCSYHDAWARKHGSTLETRLRYTPADVFETFPFPHSDPATPIPALESIGEAYHEHRRQIMLARQEGLTATYNRFHNPEETAEDIARLRALHLQMDQAVAAAYGWSDLALGHGFHETPQGLRYTLSESARREVLGRLLALNHARYEAEVKAGLHSKGKSSRKGAKTQGRKGKGAAGKGAAGKGAGAQGSKTGGTVRGKQVSLPGMEDDSPQQLGFWGEEE